MSDQEELEWSDSPDAPKSFLSFYYALITSAPGDGFVTVELADAPNSPSWVPPYNLCPIDCLIPGPIARNIEGRIVHLSTYHSSPVWQPRARGWHYLILQDDTAPIYIKLYFAKTPYALKLGQVMSVWTGFFSSTLPCEMMPYCDVPISTNLFPERVASDYIFVHPSDSKKELYRTPLGYKHGRQFWGLITLDCFLRGAHDHDQVTEIKVLLVVKSISPSKKVVRDTKEHFVCHVVLMDTTAEIQLTLWNELIYSAREWRPSETVLLFTKPRYRPPYIKNSHQKGNLEILKGTTIDVDPEMENAKTLRKWAAAKSRREAVAWDFVEGEWDIQKAEYGSERILFTLAQLDDWARTEGNQTLVGFINITIMSTKLQTLHRRNMFMCNQCCGIALYSNLPTAECESCGKLISLKLNAHIIGAMLDETGCINGGSLLWSPHAWKTFLGQSMEELASKDIADLAVLEQRLSFLRVHLCIGWKGVDAVDGPDGRLFVLSVQM